MLQREHKLCELPLIVDKYITGYKVCVILNVTIIFPLCVEMF